MQEVSMLKDFNCWIAPQSLALANYHVGNDFGWRSIWHGGIENQSMTYCPSDEVVDHCVTWTKLYVDGEMYALSDLLQYEYTNDFKYTPPCYWSFLKALRGRGGPMPIEVAWQIISGAAKNAGFIPGNSYGSKFFEGTSFHHGSSEGRPECCESAFESLIPTGLPEIEPPDFV
jgi:hypothetical protein